MTESTNNLFAARMAQLEQQKEVRLADTPIFTPRDVQLPHIIIKPTASSWEQLQVKLAKLVDYPGVWTTVKELYDQGYGAELETLAEITLAKANKKPPSHYFTRSISKKSGNWETVTLKKVHETWDVRRIALEVMEKLQLKVESTKAILATAWRLKGGITRILALATEQGVGIRNQVGLFFHLTKKSQPAAT